MELQIWVGNLGKYNEGELVGQWFTLPVDMEEVAQAIGLNDEYEECMIFDYEAPFKISEHANIEELNAIAERMSKLDELEAQAVGEVMDMGYTAEEALTHFENGEIRFYHECRTMEDVAYEIVEECGLLDSMPENLRFYFNYEAYGRDLSIDGTFIYLGNSVYIEVCF